MWMIMNKCVAYLINWICIPLFFLKPWQKGRLYFPEGVYFVSICFDMAAISAPLLPSANDGERDYAVDPIQMIISFPTAA